MKFEKIISKEKNIDLDKIRKIIEDFCEKKKYQTKVPIKCKNMCRQWNQQVAMELDYIYGIKTRMVDVVKKDYSDKHKHAVENGMALHCFIQLKGADVFIDVTSKQFNENSDDIIFLSEDDIIKQGWEIIE